MKTNRIIESVVAFIFGLAITLTAALTKANASIIVLGALLIVIGVGCFILALVDKDESPEAVIENSVVEEPVKKEATVTKKAKASKVSEKPAVEKK